MLHTLQPLFTQQSMRANNLTGPAGPWHYPPNVTPFQGYLMPLAHY